MAPRGMGGKSAKAAARGGAAGANRRKIRRGGNIFCRSGEKAYFCKNKTQKTKTMKDQVLKAMREADVTTIPAQLPGIDVRIRHYE